TYRPPPFALTGKIDGEYMGSILSEVNVKSTARLEGDIECLPMILSVFRNYIDPIKYPEHL
ncbi:MAG: hypothetical protein PVI77_09510, partial [Desulfobacterales bacterium]